MHRRHAGADRAFRLHWRGGLLTVPARSPFVIVGAGIHGLSTAYHLALQLKATGKGDGRDIIILDKSGICAGATGIACGVIRNNYFQQWFLSRLEKNTTRAVS